MLRALIPALVVIALSALAFSAVQWGLAAVYISFAEKVQHVQQR
jgi:hypothetical protein